MADVSVIDFGDGGGNRNIKDVNAARSSAIAPIEDGSTSSAAYSVGDYICRNGQLYKVTTAIAIGDIIGNNIQETKVSNEFGSGDDNILSKTRYTITATNWSNSTDADGYYTYTLTLNPTLSMSYAPNVDIAGANDNTFSTDTEKEAYDLLDECKLTSESTLVLYAKTKPEVTFYIWVESKASSSGDEGGVAESIIGPVENSTTASKAYAIGEHFIRNDKFCTCIATIASGATLTLNTNYVEGTIAEAISNCIRYVDSAKIELGNLSWITTVAGMKYADASSYVTIPSNAKIVSAVLFDWGNCPSDLIIQPYISADSKFRLMSNKSSGSYVYYRIFYIV